MVDKKGKKLEKKVTSGFAIASTIVGSVCIPYVIYSIMINQFGVANAPEGYPFPRYRDAYKIVIGAIVCQVWHAVVDYTCYDFFYSIAKKKDNEVVRRDYATKATTVFYQLFFHTISTVWGYYVLKDTDWLPWYLGGQNNGQLVNTCKNLPFIDYP